MGQYPSTSTKTGIFLSAIRTCQYGRGRDNGHYPTFDLFKAYYAIVDNYTKEIQYISDEIYVTDKYNLLVEDRNKDGISELYISYFKDGKFSVDEQGYNLRTTRCYDRIEWNPTGKNFKSSGK